MSNLTVDVKLQGVAAGAGLNVKAWPQSAFSAAPQRGSPGPGTPTATAATNGSGVAALTGLTTVAYFVQVTDPSGGLDWFPIEAGNVGGTVVCNIPFQTPSATTGAIDAAGPTAGGRYGPLLIPGYSHVHSIPPSGAASVPAFQGFCGTNVPTTAGSFVQVRVDHGSTNGFGSFSPSTFTYTVGLAGRYRCTIIGYGDTVLGGDQFISDIYKNGTGQGPSNLGLWNGVVDGVPAPTNGPVFGFVGIGQLIFALNDAITWEVWSMTNSLTLPSYWVNLEWLSST